MENLLPSLLAPGLRLLFVGFNPSVRAARLGHYYAGRNNQFWALLGASGITPRRLAYTEDRLVSTLGIGITDLVPRPTRAAADVSEAEYREGAARLRERLEELRPAVVAYNGKGVYLRAARVASAPWGLQPGRIVPGVADFVVPSPSGLARLPFAEKAAWFTELRQLADYLAGLPPPDAWAAIATDVR
jgi:TDG/mug DNA glycosylase family protein